MKYNINIDKARMRVNTRIRGEPEILLEDCILVSVKDEDLKYSKIDRLNTIIYPKGCENLDSPETVFVDGDFRHQKLGNAGYIYNMRLSEDELQTLADIKIGEQHKLIDKDNKEYGSSYAHALMSIAEKQASTAESIKAGKTYKDFINQDTFARYFLNKTVARLTGLSVELDWTEEPQANENGVIEIKKYSIVRVTLLIGDKTGQQQSRLNFNNVKFKKRNMEELNTIITNLDLFESKDLAKIRTSEIANEYLVYEQIKNRACLACQAEAKEREEELRAELDSSKKRSEEEIMAQLAKLTEIVMSLTSQLEMMKSPQPEQVRDAETTPETTPPVVETKQENEEIKPVPVEIQPTRMAPITKEFNLNQY